MRSVQFSKADVVKMTASELWQNFEIELDEDGSVWDECEQLSYRNVVEWYDAILDETKYISSSKRPNTRKASAEEWKS